jgi:hypothetical protein
MRKSRECVFCRRRSCHIELHLQLRYAHYAFGKNSSPVFQTEPQCTEVMRKSRESVFLPKAEDKKIKATALVSGFEAKKQTI